MIHLFIFTVISESSIGKINLFIKLLISRLYTHTHGRPHVRIHRNTKKINKMEKNF